MVKRRRQHHAGVKMVILTAGAAICLSSCGGDTKSSGVDPIEWYRDLSGDSKNDIKDKAAANSKNLEQGGKVPYPNLASVPKEPDNAITKADRDKMAQSLIADRTNAQYTDEQLRAGQNMQSVSPPPPQVSVTPSPKMAAASATTAVPSAVTAPTATRPPPPAAAAPVGVAPPPAPTAAPKVAAAPAQPVKQEPLPPVAPTPKEQQLAAIPSAAVPATDKTADATPPSAQTPKKSDAKKKQVKRGSEQPPQESSLRSPTIPAMPKGEAVHEPPPPPVDTPEPKRTARSSRAEEVAAATPSHDDLDAGKSQRSGGQTVEIKFTPGPSRNRILEVERNRLAQVARLVERNNKARVRIVGYAGAPPQGATAQREFESFNAALDNAKAVGIELAKLGVPPNRIDIETRANAGSADRAEIFVEY
jgi:hypothetical protein